MKVSLHDGQLYPFTVPGPGDRTQDTVRGETQEREAQAQPARADGFELQEAVGKISQGDSVAEDPICDTEVQTYPEEAVWSLDVKDDIWAEYIAMDRSNQRRRTAQGLKTPGRLCPLGMGEEVESLVSVEGEPPSSRAHRWSAALILAGVVVCILPAAWLGMNLGVYPDRTVCPSPPTGNGCYEGELMISSILTVPIFLVCAAVSAILTTVFRYDLEPRLRWRPFTVFCVSVLMIMGIAAITAALDPR